MHTGFIKVPRALMETVSWRRGLAYQGLMLNLLMRAAWKAEADQSRPGLRPGQMFLSLVQLYKECHLPYSTGRYMLRQLAADGFLCCTSIANRISLITLFYSPAYADHEKGVLHLDCRSLAPSLLVRCQPSLKEEEEERREKAGARARAKEAGRQLSSHPASRAGGGQGRGVAPENGIPAGEQGPEEMAPEARKAQAPGAPAANAGAADVGAAGGRALQGAVEPALAPEERGQKGAARRPERQAAPKERLGEGGHVRLTSDERARLEAAYGVGEVAQAIEFLDQAIAAKGRDPYHSHYAAMKKWVFDAVAEQRLRRAKLAAAGLAGASGGVGAGPAWRAEAGGGVGQGSAGLQAGGGGLAGGGARPGAPLRGEALTAYNVAVAKAVLERREGVA